ncbi:MAG: hypothetical protein M3347_16190, partial [Armatimonadota bacterium]|nr:hypothetical protein [Armatimonadota bacterium]
LAVVDVRDDRQIADVIAGGHIFVWVTCCVCIHQFKESIMVATFPSLIFPTLVLAFILLSVSD